MVDAKRQIDIIPGLTYRSKSNLWHVRAVLADDGIAVVRYWSRRRGYWQYKVDWIDVLAALLGDGTYKLVSTGKRKVA